MQYVLRPLQWVYCLYALCLFVGLMLLLFPFVIIASFFGRIRGGNLIFKICTFWANIWFPLVFIFPRRIFESPHNRQKQYIFVVNHKSLLDAAILPKVFRQPIRALGKAEMSKIPVFGFIYRNAIVMVDRSDARNRAESVRILKSIIGKGISVLFFPEGTYNETTEPLKEFYSGAFRVAIETQTPIKPILLLDSYSRLHYQRLFSLNPGRCRVVFLEEVQVTGCRSRDIERLRQEVFSTMEKKLREYEVCGTRQTSHVNA